MNDIIINKCKSIQRCIERVREEYQNAGERFPEDYTRQDAAILNLTRACEQSIDLANFLIKQKKLGIPESSRDSFDLLHSAGLIDNRLTGKLKRMTGFRNTAVHMYQKLDIDILISIIKTDINDLLLFSELILKLEKPLK